MVSATLFLSLISNASWNDNLTFGETNSEYQLSSQVSSQCSRYELSSQVPVPPQDMSCPLKCRSYDMSCPCECGSQDMSCPCECRSQDMSCYHKCLSQDTSCPRKCQSHDMSCPHKCWSPHSVAAVFVFGTLVMQAQDKMARLRSSSIKIFVALWLTSLFIISAG